MKPRIFVSSTFYDLKYIREDLSNYIKAHDFEPILFEDGDIGYNPGMPLDDSCYKAMENADMAILIIGGNYGSPATGEKSSDFDEFISVTRNEFRKGVERGVPFYVFIDRNVFSEYGIYELNAKEIEAGKCNVKFKATKNINVFRFIKEIQSIKQISITEFDKVANIKDFLSKQWSDMFKSYLASIKEQKDIEQIQDSINSMNVLIQKMDKIMDVIGKEVLKDSHSEYQQIVEEAEKAEGKNTCLLLSKLIKVDVNISVIRKRREQVKVFLNAINEMYKEQKALCEERGIDIDDVPLEIADLITNGLINELQKNGMGINQIQFKIFAEINNIHPILDNSEKMKEVYTVLCSSEYYHRIFKIVKQESKDA